MDPVSRKACSNDAPLRILALLTSEPFPPTGGLTTVLYNDLKFLAARGHKLTVLALTHDKSADPRDLADIAEAEYFYRPRSARWWEVIKNTARSLPFTVVRQHDSRLLNRARDLVAGGSVDVVLIEESVMGRHSALLKQAAPVATYLRGHTVFAAVTGRYYKSQRNPVLRFLGWRQFVKAHRYENEVLATFDCISEITPVDVEQVRQMNSRVKCHVLYSGVDLDYFKYHGAHGREPDTIVHVGNLDQVKLPGMLWFYDKVLPLIRQRHPSAKLELVGRTPPSRLQRADPKEVVVHGLVPDVRPYLARGKVFISPQFVGSGIRIKILNAMAAGNAVVATTVGAEGIPTTPGENILIADDEQAFADQVCAVLEDAALGERIGRRARQLIEEGFGWPGIAEELEKQLRDAIRRHGEGRQSAHSPAVIA